MGVEAWAGREQAQHEDQCSAARREAAMKEINQRGLPTHVHVRQPSPIPGRRQGLRQCAPDTGLKNRLATSPHTP